MSITPTSLPLLLALTLFGCVEENSPDVGGPGGDDVVDEGAGGDDDDPVEVEVDCVEDASAFEDIVVEDTRIPTVFRVSWSSPEAVAAAVNYAVDADETRSTPLSDVVTDHVELVRGLPASTDVSFRLHDEEGRCSELMTHRTGTLSPSLPLLERTGSELAAPGFVSVPIITPDQYFLAVLDSRGRYVWAMEAQKIPWRLEYAKDGESLYYLEQADDSFKIGSIRKVGWDGEPRVVFEGVGLHTDFAEADDGTIYAIAWDLREFVYEGESRKILGDRIVRLDMDTGRFEDIWSVFDHWTPDLSEVVDAGTYFHDPDVEDWSHVNGISYDAANHALLVSVSNLQTVLSLDLETEEVDWMLGDTDESVSWTREQAPVKNPHSIYRKPNDELVVFNRQALDGTECSTVDTLVLDPDAGTAKPTSSFESQDCLAVYFIGLARPISGDRTLVAWTTSGRLDQLDADNNVVWSLQSSLGAGVAFPDHSLRLYPQ